MNTEIKRVENLKKQIIDAYSEDAAQEKYLAKAENGLWDSEKYFITKYWDKAGSVLDVGCGTGRTTLALAKEGYEVTGLDLVPVMITHARHVAQKNNQDIPYEVGDATDLRHSDNSFNYVLFSNLGWPQIPTYEQRLKALSEIHRVLKPGGIFILITARRVWMSSFFWFWVKQWIKHYLLRPIGFRFNEEVFGDRFYDRESKDMVQIYKTPQYIYIPSVVEVKKQLQAAGFELLEANGTLQISKHDIRAVPPMFYIAKKV